MGRGHTYKQEVRLAHSFILAILDQVIGHTCCNMGLICPLGTFCPLGRFVSGMFCPWAVLSLGTICPWDVLYVHHPFNIIYLFLCADEIYISYLTHNTIPLVVKQVFQYRNMKGACRNEISLLKTRCKISFKKVFQQWL